MAQYSNFSKPVRILDVSYQWSTTRTYQLVVDWTDSVNRTISAKTILFPTSKNKILETCKSLKYVPTNKDVVYFDESSNFPRFKLSTSSIKRCIKPEKSACTIISSFNDWKFQEFPNSLVYEDSDNIYIVLPVCDYSGPSMHYHHELTYKQFFNNTKQFLQQHNMITPDMHLIYEGTVTMPSDACTNTVYKIMYGTYTKLVTDEQLDEIVNKTLPTLSEEDLDGLISMLSSSDTSVKNLGLKLLLGYNSSKTPVSIGVLIKTYERGYRYNNTWSSVGFQQLLNTLKYDKTPYNLSTNISTLINNTSDIDKNLLKKIAVKIIKEQYTRTLNSIVYSDNLTALNLSVSLHIDE